MIYYIHVRKNEPRERQTASRVFCFEGHRKADDSNVTPEGAHHLANEPCHPDTLTFPLMELNAFRAEDGRLERLRFHAASPSKRASRLGSSPSTVILFFNSHFIFQRKAEVSNPSGFHRRPVFETGCAPRRIRLPRFPSPLHKQCSRKELNLWPRPSQDRALSPGLREPVIDKEGGRIERHSPARAHRFQNGLPRQRKSPSALRVLAGLVGIEPASSVRQTGMLTITPQPHFSTLLLTKLTSPPGFEPGLTE